MASPLPRPLSWPVIRRAALALGAAAALAVSCAPPPANEPHGASAPPEPSVPAAPDSASPGIPAPGPRGAERGLPVISWEAAGQFYGREVIVEGKIVAAKNTGRACFLNFHRNWKRYFSAVIFARRFERFPAPPETLYLGRTVRVTGRVRDYQGKPEVVIDSPEQIKIID
jgi:hypothetical protein